MLVTNRQDKAGWTPATFIIKLRWSSGQDIAFSRRDTGSNPVRSITRCTFPKCSKSTMALKPLVVQGIKD